MKRKKITITKKNDVCDVLNKILESSQNIDLNELPPAHTQTIERHINGLHAAWGNMLISLSPKIKCELCYKKHGLIFKCICKSPNN